MDRPKNPEDQLGKAETLLVQAAQLGVDWHGNPEPAGALVAQAQEKIPAPQIGTGGELIQEDRLASAYLLNTLDYPNFIAADASEQRMSLAKKAGAIALGVDLADTIQAANSAERMLAHQLAATHVGAMRLLGQLNTMFHENSIAKEESVNIRATRLAGAASRLLTAYQQGMVTLDRLRSGGKQTIIVQHVQVNEGGQAVVSGKMKAPSRRGGRDAPHRPVGRGGSEKSARGRAGK